MTKQATMPSDPLALARLRELASMFDCILDEDLQLLAGVSAVTTEAWRKRGDGPAFCRVGNRPLYPRQAVAEWLMTRLRERKPVDSRDLL